MKLNKLRFRLTRRRLYLSGVATAAVGLFVLVTVLLSVARTFGDLSEFEGQAVSIATRALGGVVLVAAGFAVMTLTDNGLTNGFVEIDALRDDESSDDDAHNDQNARHEKRFDESSPDAANVVDASTHESGGSERNSLSAMMPPEGFCCLACRAVNDQEARYCDQCGANLRPVNQSTDKLVRSAQLSQTAV